MTVRARDYAFFAVDRRRHLFIVLLWTDGTDSSRNLSRHQGNVIVGVDESSRRCTAAAAAAALWHDERLEKARRGATHREGVCVLVHGDLLEERRRHRQVERNNGRRSK